MARELQAFFKAVGEVARLHPGRASHRRSRRRILRQHGFEFMVEYICAPRMARGLQLFIFNRQDRAECERASACFGALLRDYRAAGYTVSRIPVDFQVESMSGLTGLPDLLRKVKSVLDPNGVLAPGRYGIG